MSLTLYTNKRKFEKTPEPKGKKAAPSDKELRFVVQKHAASRLHYDFRLEMEGVLKSWAVPKGPSLNPEDKRLAMMVEDHPYDYRTFEGSIPKGNYGAGTVMVWDQGTYEPLDTIEGGKKAQEKLLLKQLKEGNLKFRLNGEKLKGDYALVHTKGREDNAWLLIKKKDKYATTKDITEKDKSVLSGKTLDQIAGNDNPKKSGEIENSVRNQPEKSSAKSIKGTTKKISSGASKKKPPTLPKKIIELLQKGKPASYNTGLKPMLASLTEDAFDSEDWVFEIKWDGYRAIAGILDGKVELQSRNNLSFNKKYYPVAEALQNWKVNAIVDGEIIATNEQGKTHFQQLQAWQKSGKGELAYYVFDILWLDGFSVTNLPLLERKEILKSIIPGEGIINYSDHIHESGKDFFELALKEGLEGIMAKKADSLYHPGVRTQQWLKIKTHRRQEVVIGGFTKGRNSRQYFGALILGIYENNELVYIGHTGSGFNQKSLGEMYKKLQPLITDVCPFKKKPKTNMPAVWVKPELVAEVKFQEWTNENILRIPIFLGLREDKNAKDVKKEQNSDTEAVLIEEKQTSTRKGKNDTPENSETKPATAKIPKKKIVVPEDKLITGKDKEQHAVVDKQNLKFTNVDKFYWKKEKITKGELINYYHRIAPFILPYMKDRPQSLNRHPNGVGSVSFYQKDVAGKIPDWIKTYDYLSESDGEIKKFLVCTNEASLLYMANWGCIEMNPWHSRVTSPANPDYCVIDLDPEDISFEKVVEVANVVKKVLDELQIDACCKTSGATGLHIYIPLGAKYTYDQSKQVAELIVQFVHDEIPEFTSLERSPKKRQKKVYLDFLQNRTIQTLAAPYSIRPKDGATVSTPLYWEELKPGLSPANFTMMNIFGRLKSEGDLFQPVLQKGIDLNKTLKRISGLIGTKG